MYAKLLIGVFLFALQIIINESSVTSGDENIVASETTSTTVRSSTLPEGYVSFPVDHAAYKIHKDNSTWYAAREKCIAEGAHLAIVDTLDKIIHVNSLKTEDWGLEWLHVGIYKTNLTEEWVRIDNDQPATSLPWLLDGPDDDGNCAGISFIADALVNYNCDWDNEYFVCAIPI